jgi:hypothetical protein
MFWWVIDSVLGSNLLIRWVLSFLYKKWASCARISSYSQKPYPFTRRSYRHTLCHTIPRRWQACLYDEGSLTQCFVSFWAATRYTFHLGHSQIWEPLFPTIFTSSWSALSPRDAFVIVEAEGPEAGTWAISTIFACQFGPISGKDFLIGRTDGNSPMCGSTLPQDTASKTIG